MDIKSARRAGIHNPLVRLWLAGVYFFNRMYVVVNSKQIVNLSLKTECYKRSKYSLFFSVCLPVCLFLSHTQRWHLWYVGFWIAEKSGGLEVFYIFIFLVHLFLFFLTFDKDNAKQNYIELKSSPCYRKYPEKIRFESVLSISLSCLSVRGIQSTTFEWSILVIIGHEEETRLYLCHDLRRWGCIRLWNVFNWTDPWWWVERKMPWTLKGCPQYLFSCMSVCLSFCPWTVYIYMPYLLT